MNYHVERLGNGLTRVFDRGSKLAGLYDAEGRYHSGDLYAPTLGELVGDTVSNSALSTLSPQPRFPVPLSLKVTSRFK